MQRYVELLVTHNWLRTTFINMAQAKWDRQVGKESVEDNFDEMLKVFEGDAVLQGPICESTANVTFFISMHYVYYIHLLYRKKA